MVYPMLTDSGKALDQRPVWGRPFGGVTSRARAPVAGPAEPPSEERNHVNRTLRPLAALLVATAAAILAACSRADARPPKNVVLVSIDTLRSDRDRLLRREGEPDAEHRPARGPRRPLREGLYSSVPVTTPSHAVLLNVGTCLH